MTTEKNAKYIIMKILSILCLVVVLISGFLPWLTFEGREIDQLFDELSSITQDITDDEKEMFDMILEQGNVEFGTDEFMNSLENVFNPLKDGAVSPMEFWTLHQNIEDLSGKMYAITEMDGAEEFGFELDAETKEILEMASIATLVPVGIFGVIAVFVILRIVLRLFNRRGLGVGVAVLTGLYTIPVTLGGVVLGMALAQQGGLMIQATAIPMMAFVCSILGCVFWGQARKGLAPKKQPEYVVLEQEIPVPVGQEQEIPKPLDME